MSDEYVKTRFLTGFNLNPSFVLTEATGPKPAKYINPSSLILLTQRAAPVSAVLHTGSQSSTSDLVLKQAYE